jgi:hypothetical protein
MPAALSALRQFDVFAENRYERGIWSTRLLAAFSDTNKNSHLLAPAEEVVAARLGDPVIVGLAVMASLFNARPQRALVFLKRLRNTRPGAPYIACKRWP